MLQKSSIFIAVLLKCTDFIYIAGSFLTKKRDKKKDFSLSLCRETKKSGCKHLLGSSLLCFVSTLGSAYLAERKTVI